MARKLKEIDGAVSLRLLGGRFVTGGSDQSLASLLTLQGFPKITKIVAARLGRGITNHPLIACRGRGPLADVAEVVPRDKPTID